MDSTTKQASSAATAGPLLAARPRLDSRRHSDSVVGDHARPLVSPDDPSNHLTPSSPSPPCATPRAHDPDTTQAASPARTHAFYTRIPTNPSDLRTIHWQLAADRLTCLDSHGALVVEFALDELVWRADGMYGIEFGLDSRFIVAGEEPEVRIEEATSTSSSSSSLGTIASESGEAGAGGTSMSRELLAALQQQAEKQNNNPTGSTGTVIVHVSNQDGLAVESMDSFVDERNPRAGIMSRPGTAADTSRLGARTASTDPETETTDNAGYVEGFRIYSENAMEVTHWLSMLAAYRTRRPLIPRITYSDPAARLIDSYESLAPPANTRRNSAAIGNPEALMATVATHLQHNATPAAARVTIFPTTNVLDHPSLTPPGSVGSSSSLAGTSASTTAKFIRILDAAHGPVVVSTMAGGRVLVTDTASGKTVLDVRDSLEMLHDKLGGGAPADSQQSSLGSLQSVDSANKIPLAGCMGKAAVVGYKMPLKGEAQQQQLPEATKYHPEVDVNGDDTLGNAQWKALKSGGEPLTLQPAAPFPPKVVIGHPEPSANEGGAGHDADDALGDTLKGSGSAMRLKGAVVAAAEQTRQDAVGLGRLGM
ncbi:hypothetical protein BCR44DRAFT_1517381 [Catenaria anguillulae PL171]|uniref:Uncharacterized protein n=1 Tax=Catenaria anguillulae PL171 TaxID=765915 RepID=A0A1Y2H6K6_9FUNG|nr:hypothetical protein BCR44DRAFT_1517381 [Catenaria anguillulae PL171]